jgi:hypothetical protein
MKGIKKTLKQQPQKVRAVWAMRMRRPKWPVFSNAVKRQSAAVRLERLT